jgi:hypothetical protein
MIDLSTITIDLLYMLAYTAGQIAILIGAAMVTGTFFTALTIMTVGLVRGKVAV